jgi:ParB-like chromosome segregation protein Spo0J
MYALKVPIDQLMHDPSNARTHNKANIEAIKGSLAKFGQQKPLVVTRSNVVIAGNGTLQAARDLGWTEIAVVYTSLSGPEAMAFALSDNRTAELASWDNGILGHQLQSLWDDGFNIADIGFDPKDYLADIPIPGTDESTREPPALSATEHLVVITCASEFEQADLYERLKAEGYECKIMS